MSHDTRCECTLAVKMTGDGCRYCQPQEYIDRLHDMVDEERKEARAEVLALKRELLDITGLLIAADIVDDWRTETDFKRYEAVIERLESELGGGS